MLRQSHLSPVGIAQHIIQWGNNHQVCFVSDEDRAVFANWLYGASRKFQVRVHAWVFMPNHIHLLATPLQVDAVSKLMEYLGQRYVYYFNHVNGRIGPLWESSFRSCLVENGHYILDCQRYIETHPVRDGVVDDPADYRWSSYRAHALSESVKLSSPHEMYLTLGNTPSECQTKYRELFTVEVGRRLISKIRHSMSEGLALGTDKFKVEVDNLISKPISSLSCLEAE